MLMNRRRAAAALGAAGTLLLLYAVPAQALPDPDGTYDVPVEVSSLVSFERLELSSEVGGLDASRRVFTWSDPDTRTPLPWSVDLGWLTATSGPYVVGIASDGVTPSLTLVDVRDGAIATREVTLDYRPVGTLADAWVVVEASKVRIVPFDTEVATSVLVPPEGTFVRSAGIGVSASGLVYVVKVVAGTTTYKLIHTAADLTTHTVLADLGGTLPTAGEMKIAMTGDAVAWIRSDTREISYVLLGDEPTTVTVPPALVLGSIAVVEGAVAVGANGSMYVWVPGEVFPGAPIEADGLTVDRALPAATTLGAPAFVINLRSDFTGAAWFLFAPGDGVVYVDQGAPALPGLMALGAAPGLALAQYAGLSEMDEENTFAPLHVYSLGASSATTEFVVPRAAWMWGGQGFAASGSRTAVIEWPTGASEDPVLRLRDGSTVTATVRLPAGEPSLSVSGPWTAVGVDSWGEGAQGFVVTPDGRTVATLPPDVFRVAQDGPRTAYVEPDGSVWLRDVSQPLSDTNPRRIVGACAEEYDCRSFLGLAGDRLVVANESYEDWEMLRVYDTVTRAQTGSLRIFSGDEASNAYALAGDVLLVTRDTTMHSVDLASLPLTLVPRATPAYPVAAAAGARAVWPRVTDEGDTLATAPIAPDWGAAGVPRLLGAWSPYGAVVSTGGPAWTPSITVSGALDSWTLTMRNASGDTVRTWTSSSPTTTGQVAGVSWNGRTAGGAAVPAGRYTWTLTGDGPDGGPVALSGTGAATGTVTVAVQASSRATLSGTHSATTGSAVTLRGSLVAAATSEPAAYEPVTLWRRTSTGGAWVKVATSRTTSLGTVSWRVRIDRNAYYQMRHASTPRYGAAASAAFLVVAR